MNVFYPFAPPNSTGIRINLNGADLPDGSHVEVWQDLANKCVDMRITTPKEAVPDMTVHSLDEVVRAWSKL